MEAKLTDAGPKRCADDDDDGDNAEGSDENEDAPRLCVRLLSAPDDASSTSVPFASSSLTSVPSSSSSSSSSSYTISAARFSYPSSSSSSSSSLSRPCKRTRARTNATRSSRDKRATHECARFFARAICACSGRTAVAKKSGRSRERHCACGGKKSAPPPEPASKNLASAGGSGSDR